MRSWYGSLDATMDQLPYPRQRNPFEEAVAALPEAVLIRASGAGCMNLGNTLAQQGCRSGTVAIFEVCTHSRPRGAQTTMGGFNMALPAGISSTPEAGDRIA